MVGITLLKKNCLCKLHVGMAVVVYCHHFPCFFSILYLPLVLISFAMYLCLSYIFLSTSCSVNPPSAEISVSPVIDLKIPNFFDSVNKGKKGVIFLFRLMVLFAFFGFSGSFILSGNHARETGD